MKSINCKIKSVKSKFQQVSSLSFVKSQENLYCPVMALFDLDDRINSRQAARILGCSITTLNNYVREGKIRCYGISPRCRFFLRSEITEYLKRRAGTDRAVSARKKS